MRQIEHGYRGASILFGINADLILFAVTLVVALLAAGYIATF